MKDFKTLAGSLFKGRRAIVPGIAAVLVLVLILLPVGMSWYLKRWLLENGGDQVAIEDIDVNLFTGKVAIKQLRLEAEGRPRLDIPRLDVELDWLPLFSRQVLVRSLRVDGVDIEVDEHADGSMKVGGVALPQGGSDGTDTGPSTWGVGLDRLQVINSTVSFHSPDLQLDTRLDDLLLQDLKTWVTEPAPLTFKGSVNGARVSLDGHLPALSDAFGYAGKLHVEALPLQAFAHLAEAAVHGLEGRLSVDTQLDVRVVPGEPPVISQQGVISTRAVKFDYEGISVAYSGLGWDGRTDITQDADGGALVQASGGVKVDGLDMDGGAEGKRLRIVSFAAANLAGIKLADSGDLSITSLKLSDAVFARNLAEQGSVLSAGAIDVDNIQVSGGNQVAIGTIEWRDILSVVRREADGVWRPVRILETLPFAHSEAPAKEPASGEPAGRVKVGQISVTGDSAVVLIDETVKPAFNTRIKLTEARLRDIDNSRPEHRSPITLKGQTDKYSRIDVAGTIQPFADKPGADLKLQLEGISLTQLSPYTANIIGYVFESGHLDAASTLKLNKGQLDASNKLTIRELTVSPAKNESQAEFDAKLSLPIDSALDMLRDKNNTIKLDLPVSGDMANPDVDLSDVINTALGKALKKGSMTYLTMALQPYGALITIARIAGEQATKVRLQPVVFDPGSAVNRKGSDDYLDKVAGILKDRPEVNVKVCGLAVEEDRPALAALSAGKEKGEAGKGEKDKDKEVVVSDGQLLDLARQRAAAVKDYLVEGHSVTASRLVDCQPHIDDAEDEGAPRVDLLI